MAKCHAVFLLIIAAKVCCAGCCFCGIGHRNCQGDGLVDDQLIGCTVSAIGIPAAAVDHRRTRTADHNAADRCARANMERYADVCRMLRVCCAADVALCAICLLFLTSLHRIILQKRFCYIICRREKMVSDEDLLCIIEERRQLCSAGIDVGGFCHFHCSRIFAVFEVCDELRPAGNMR